MYVMLFAVMKLLYSFTSFGRNTSHSASTSAGVRSHEFGPTYVVSPEGEHQATIVWLHGIASDGYSWCTLFETTALPNTFNRGRMEYQIKWICPTAPKRPVTVIGGSTTTAWFDVNELYDGYDDVDGLEASAAYVASLLANEPAHIKLGIGGFSMGAAQSLYCATCFVRGKFENGENFSQNISAIFGLSGWLPLADTLSDKIEGVAVASARAAYLPILLSHGKEDDMVDYKFGAKSYKMFISTGFRDVTFKSYAMLDHNVIPEEMDDLYAWLSFKLGLDGI